MKHKFKRFLQRLAINLFRILGSKKPKHEMDVHESEGVAIFRKIINKKSITLLLDPDVHTGNKYIQYEDMTIILKQKPYELNIINHVYSYQIFINTQTYDKLEKLFNTAMERKIADLKINLNSDINKSLSTIYKSL